ncbi:MAG: winged helix-turn-helix domain-containing protein [Pyrinomonadaceae bacterium]
MAVGTKNFYEFSGFRLDAHKLRLNYKEHLVELPPKSLEALKLLLESNGETVTREDLLTKLWGDTFVEEANLTVAISRLRKALASFNGGETFIQTIPRRGYRFVGDARETIEIKAQPVVIENARPQAETNGNHAAILPSPTPALPTPVDQTASHSKSRVWFMVLALISVGLLAAFALWNAQADRPGSSIPEANEAFVAGDTLLKKRSPCPSIPYFREAVARDPNFGRAYASLAAAQAMCGFLDGIDDNIEKALTLDPRSAEAHATNGFLRTFVHWDWDGAERSLRRALELNPDLAMAHHWLGVVLSIRGQLSEAAGEMKRAIDLDPQSPLYHADLCQIYYFVRAYDYALDHCGRAQGIDPNFGFTNVYLRDIHMALGDEKTASEYEIKLQYKGISDSPKSTERQILELEGLQAYRRYRLDKLLKQWHDSQVKPEDRHHTRANIANLYAATGDKENALTWLDAAVSESKGLGGFGLPFIGVDPIYDILRGDPRFEHILAKMNLSRPS